MPHRTPAPLHQTPRSSARALRHARTRRIRTAVATLAAASLLLGAGLFAGSGHLRAVVSPGDEASLVAVAEPTPADTEPGSAAAVGEPVTAPAPSVPATLTVAAVGDMLFDRQVKEMIRQEGGLAPLEHVATHLAAADVTVGNLETPLSERGIPLPEKDYTFRGDPRAIEGLSASGFTFLSLANNHILDYGSDALFDTIELLEGAGIGFAGAGPDRTAAWRPATATYGDTTVAFLSFSHILPAGFIAADGKAGVAPGRTDMEAVASAIRAAKAEHDYVLVAFHWGVEYADDANADQVRDARRAIDAGADMVLAHHPHVIQGIEFYRDRLIAYSLGDFVFDHYSRKTGEAFILDAELGPHGVANVRATPVYLQSIGQPKFVSGSEAEAILERLKLISGRHGTSVIVDGDIARVIP